MKQIKQIIPVIVSIIGTSFGSTSSTQDYRSALEDIFNRQKQALEALHIKNTPERSVPPSTQQQTQHAEDSSLTQSLLAELVASQAEVARLSVALAVKEREVVDLTEQFKIESAAHQEIKKSFNCVAEYFSQYVNKKVQTDRHLNPKENSHEFSLSVIRFKEDEIRLDGLARQVEGLAMNKNWSAAADIERANPGVLQRANISGIAKVRIERSL